MEDKTKNAIKFVAKSVAKLIISKISIFAIPIIVFIFAVAIAMSIGGDSDSSAASKSKDLTSGSGFELFLQWLHTYEGGTKTDDGKYYIVESDGSDNGTAVGHGVDIGTHGAELRKAGYDTSIGSKIPVDVVDAIEEREVSENMKKVKSETKGLNLTDYQIYALVSRVFNCGPTGALTGHYGQGMSFKEAYKQFWSQDRDDKYGKKEQVDYNHNLYSKFMNLPVTSQGEYLEGLENRRKSEWLLFQTGYFDRGVEAYWKNNSGENSTEDSGSTDISTNLTGTNKEKMEKMIARAIEIANDVDYKYYTYTQGNGRLGPHSYDCSGFCYSLYKKYFNIEIPSTTKNYGSKGYVGSVGSVELKPGDILWREGHVELYIGNNKRAGAHEHYPSNPKNDISIKKGTSGFTKVYRFIK